MDHHEPSTSATLRRSSSFKKILKLWGSGERGSAGGAGGTGGVARPEGRRPDPVSEERGAALPHEPDEDTSQPDQSHSHGHHPAKSKPSATSINRSESYKERIHQKRQLRERRKTSDPNLSKTSNDVEVEVPSLYNHSGSSSNSSLSTRSLDSPSNSLEAVSGGGGGGVVGGGWDSDTEAEADPPDWKHTVPEDVLNTLSAHEIKRQEVINELFQTERSHVRGLKVLERVFHLPMKEQQILPPEQIHLLFANLEEMLDIHSQFNNSMKAKRREGPVVAEVGDLLYSMFEGPEGEHFQQAAATFCARQHIALEALKEKRRKDPKLNSFLSDAEGNPVCRRLQLKDIIPSGMLRLTKYPLLLKNLEKYSGEGTEEAMRVQRAEERSREILHLVNTAVKEAEDQHRLAEIQRKLDKAPFDKVDHPMANEFKNLDLTQHRLIYEGSLNWRITNRPKLIDLHVLLLEDVIILLQKQDDKFVLKFYSSTLSPVIKVSTVIVRPNAVDKKALYLVNTAQNGAQIYDLVAASSSEKRQWFKHISDAAEAYKAREGKRRLDDTDKTKDSEDSASGGSELLSPPRNGAEESASEVTTPLPSPSPQTSPSPQHAPPPPPPPPIDTHDAITRTLDDVSVSVCPLRQTTAESSLVEPSEVVICQSPVLTAEPVLTPLERLRRVDERIREALEEKQRLVAELLHVPRDDLETIAELAAEPSCNKDAADVLLAAVTQANKLWSLVSDALTIGEEEAVTAAATTAATANRRLPGVPARPLCDLSTALNRQLTLLQEMVRAGDVEREQLRREVLRLRESLHAVYEQPKPVDTIVASDYSGQVPPCEDLLAAAASTTTAALQVFVDSSPGDVVPE